jgi:hypothetical protein
MICGTAGLGSARGSRAVFGDSPKTVAGRNNLTEDVDIRSALRDRVQLFDEPSNRVRQRRAFPNPENRALK